MLSYTPQNPYFYWSSVNLENEYEKKEGAQKIKTVSGSETRSCDPLTAHISRGFF